MVGLTVYYSKVFAQHPESCEKYFITQQRIINLFVTELLSAFSKSLPESISCNHLEYT